MNIVKYINKATHWIAYHDDKSFAKEFIIPDKLYKLEMMFDPVFGRDDYFILDETGTYSMAYLIHKGDYVKVEQ